MKRGTNDTLFDPSVNLTWDNSAEIFTRINNNYNESRINTVTQYF